MRVTKELRATAYHEAGHAVAAWHEHLPIRAVSVIADDDTLGRVHHPPSPASFRPDIDAGPRARTRIEAHAIAFLAGTHAERLVVQRVSDASWSEDRRRAGALLSYLCGSAEEEGAYWNLMNIRARGLMKQDQLRPALDALAAALLEHRRLSGRRARQIILEALGLTELDVTLRRIAAGQKVAS